MVGLIEYIACLLLAAIGISYLKKAFAKKNRGHGIVGILYILFSIYVLVGLREFYNPLFLIVLWMGAIGLSFRLSIPASADRFFKKTIVCLLVGSYFLQMYIRLS